MARLNEPPVSTDTLETLRRKFIRQNRDIARTNSTQSLKIRSLENECARLLSENLQLRSDVLRLKTELEGSHAQRVADHALQIKEKMEAQLVEWGTMLASLGNEPIPKNRSPRALKRPRVQRSSIGPSRISDWRRRETMSSREDLEAAALQEGRLPPLWEDKSCPRETLNQDEILALRSEAEENSDSPDLGPPPVSRFVDEDPVKLDLSAHTKSIEPAVDESDDDGIEALCDRTMSYPDLPSPSRKMESVSEAVQERPAEPVKKSVVITTAPESQTSSPVAKAGLKRKTRDEEEKENDQISHPLPMGQATNENARSVSRPIKELPSSKKDARAKPSHATQRKPLGTKSSNEALGSLKKPAKPLVAFKPEKPKARGKEDEPVRSHSKSREEPTSFNVPPPSSPEPVINIDVESESLSAEPDLTAPHSPERAAPREETADTPPPADISSRGETTRANRRARAAISYAEPNLRDKMRRPNTKHLFDAVAGEGKQIRRTSQCQRDESPSRAPSSIRSESRSTFSDISRDVDTPASPSVRRAIGTPAIDALPTSVTAERKRKDSALPEDTESGTTTIKSSTKGTNHRIEGLAAREAEIAGVFDDPDVYEFTNSPVKDDSKGSLLEEENKKSNSNRPSRSRRLSSVFHEDMQFDNANQNEKAPAKSTGSRKRASMATVKSAKSNLEETGSGTSSAEADSASAADRDGKTRDKTASHRRRSTML
ncbi:hypothetical protein GGR50DRAFT_373329 [Xylaria sp. CBS 124048]|nr:hypothetical protein GGR50DRAFT_373329 [Xylaria sp. CBS 124048]